MRGRRLLVAVAAVLLAGAALPGTAVTAGAGMRATSGDKVTFTVGVTQDVDSLNPFTGIAVGVVRDLPDAVRDAHRLRGQGLLRHAGPGAELGHLAGRAHLDLPPPARPEVVRRRAADREGRGLHVQPGHERQVRADQLRQLRGRPHLGRGDRRPHGRDEGQEAEPDHAAPLRLHPAGAHLEGHRREGGQELRQRARAGRPRRLRPVPGGGAQEGPVHPARRRTRATTRARPRSTRSCSGSSRTRTRWPRRCVGARSTSPTA